MSCLYPLEIYPLLVTSLANILYLSVGCLFVLFMVSFAGEMILSLIRQHLFIFVFISITLGGGSKKIAVIIVCVFNMLTDTLKLSHLFPCFCSEGNGIPL